MKWFIKKIVIYGLNNETRSVNLDPGVNIITGKSQTGKSALIYIVDYCLGSREYEVPRGIIRQFAQWFAILIQTEKEQIFIARQAPKNQNTTEKKVQTGADNMYIDISHEVTVPTLEMIATNTNRKAVIDELSKRLGMMDISLAKSSYDTAYTEPPTARNVVPFLFQPQNVIANKDVLFYKTDQERHSAHNQRLKRILPYVLGAIDAEYFDKKNQLDQAARTHRQIERTLREKKSLSDDGETVLRSLLGQAIALGIAQNPPDSEATIDVIRDYLASLTSIGYQQNNVEKEMLIDNTDLINSLKQSAQTTREKISAQRRQLNATEELVQATNQFSGSLQNQSARLKIVNLFDNEEEKMLTCPLCGQDLRHGHTSLQRLKEVNQEIRKQLEDVNAAAPSLNAYAKELREQISRSRLELANIETRITELYRAQEITTTENTNTIWIEQQRLLGAIQFYLDRVPEITQSIKDLERREKDARRKVSKLEEELLILDTGERTIDALRNVSNMMTYLGQRLNLESPDSTLRLDINHLTVIRTPPNGSPERLYEIGSGENWVGYHLCTLFALHAFFHNINSPVPSFLFIDQPSQIYFPEEGTKNNGGKRTDWDAVKKMYNMIFDTVEEMNNDMQVIVIDHARLDDPRFIEATKKDWHTEGALI